MRKHCTCEQKTPLTHTANGRQLHRPICGLCYRPLVKDDSGRHQQQPTVKQIIPIAYSPIGKAATVFIIRPKQVIVIVRGLVTAETTSSIRLLQRADNMAVIDEWFAKDSECVRTYVNP